MTSKQTVEHAAPVDFNEMVKEHNYARAALDDMLWERQLIEFPDSVRVSISDALGWMYEADPKSIDQAMEYWDLTAAPMYRDEKERKRERLHYGQQRIEAFKFETARAVAMCLQYSAGIFYTCGPDQKWRGFRFGMDGCEYISGFGRY